MKRRQFLQVAGSVATLGLLAKWSLAEAALREKMEKPNIVFILADDLGYTDLGCYGSSFYDTPHLDALAKQGALFTSAYAACPVCSPTRASLMTGQYPQRTGITDYIGAPQPENWKPNTQLLPAPYHEQLDLEKVTITEMLKEQGYATAFFGKWHLGPLGHWPEDQGFDINKGGIDRGGPYGGGKYFSPYDNPRLPDGPKGEHLPDRLASEVCQFMEDNRDQPFLAYFSFYSVHTPLMARPDLEEKYKKRREERGLQTQWGHDGTRDVRESQDHAVYASMVEAMDAAAGKVLAKLEELGLSENTIVIFTSDNGGLSTSEGWPTSNLPLRGGKGWLYEGGIREPLLIRWPGVTKAGSRYDLPVISPDFFTTFMSVVGAAVPPDQPLDGINLKPILQGHAVAQRSLFWDYPHYGNQGGAPGAAVRLGDWKLIEWYEAGKIELFNLATDIGEHNDLAAKEPERVQKMLAMLHDWQKQVGAKKATPNPNYDPTKRNGRFGGRPVELRGKGPENLETERI